MWEKGDYFRDLRLIHLVKTKEEGRGEAWRGQKRQKLREEAVRYREGKERCANPVVR